MWDIWGVFMASWENVINILPVWCMENTWLKTEKKSVLLVGRMLLPSASFLLNIAKSLTPAVISSFHVLTLGVYMCACWAQRSVSFLRSALFFKTWFRWPGSHWFHQPAWQAPGTCRLSYPALGLLCMLVHLVFITCIPVLLCMHVSDHFS